MALRYDELNVDALSGVRFADPAGAVACLKALPGEHVTDDTFERLLPALLDCLARSPDPDRALTDVAHWLEGVGSRTLYCRLLIDHPIALDALLALFAASQFFADIIIRNPEYFEVLANPRIRDRGRTMDGFLADAHRRIAIADTLGKKRDALRRFKPPEVLRIGARDILGYATLDQTIEEISDFAEACVRAAVEICGATEKFAVIGMGKLGARELNYASDIDLIFVHDDDLPPESANKLGEAIRDTLAAVTSAGFVFRVDLRLRPEGRFGAISRSLASCRAYYESWAEPWERQALIKARVVGGDNAVGEQFVELAQQFVYRKLVTQEFVDGIRANKRRLEAQTARAGEAQINVKQGEGAIRDIEFSVQLLQLMAGGKHPELRVRATLPALDALAGIALITESERQLLADSYRFLRNVEHRLQIMDERPVRVLPAGNAADLDKFGMRLGYADGAAFMAEYRRHTSRVHQTFTQIFYGETESGDETKLAVTAPGELPDEIAEWVEGIADPSARERLLDCLDGLGFSDPAAAASILEASELGSDYGEISPEARRRFAGLAPHLLAAAAATGLPDAALRAFDQLSVAVASRAALYRTLADEPLFLDRLLRLAAAAPVLWQFLTSHLEYLDLLADERQLDLPTPAPATANESVVARYILHERLRIGARDVWGLEDVRGVMATLTAMATNVVVAAMRLAEFDDISDDVALIGMGKLGGGELGYASDLDVLWVVSPGADTERAAAFANRVMGFIQFGLKRYGAPYDIDARLRPDGRVGVLARTVAGYAEYLDQSAQTWEKQALIRARFVAGNASVGAAFEAMAHATVYEHLLTEPQADELRHMKHRIETERCKDPTDIKLGPGGLSDIEWLTQMLQWRHGKRWPRVRVTGTLAALAALRDDAVLRQDDWETLTTAYVALTAQRNHQWLQPTTPGVGYPLPAPGGVARSAGVGLAIDRQAVRQIFERLFGVPAAAR